MIYAIMSRKINYEMYNKVYQKRTNQETSELSENDSKDHIARISTVEFNEGDEAVYMEGNLKSFERQIKRFDKHRRLAIVETELFGRKTEVFPEFE